MRFLFKLDDSIEVNIRPVILNDEDLGYTTTGIYFGSEAILRIRGMLEQWQEMKEKYENNEITKEALQDFKANYPDSLKKDYLPFEESNVKFYRKGISAKIPPDIKQTQKKHITERFLGLKLMCFIFTIFVDLEKLVVIYAYSTSQSS